MTEFSEFHTRLLSCLEQSGLEPVSAEAARKLHTLSSLLQETNEHINLTAICDDDGIILKHIADCAALASLPEERARVLDVGCGGGFPSLPLAILRPDTRITALDSTAKKLKFVTDASDALGLRNISPLAARAEDISRPPYRESFDFVCARAVAHLDVLCELCLSFVRVGGVFAAMKAGDEEELRDAAGSIITMGGELCEVRDFALALDGEQLTRSIILIKKVTETPPQYPRHYSIIKNHPLR